MLFGWLCYCFILISNVRELPFSFISPSPQIKPVILSYSIKIRERLQLQACLGYSNEIPYKRALGFLIWKLCIYRHLTIKKKKRQEPLDLPKAFDKNLPSMRSLRYVPFIFQCWSPYLSPSSSRTSCQYLYPTYTKFCGKNKN